jgi:hypothetical protein
VTAVVHKWDDHFAFTCECGSVAFNLLKSDLIECAGCQKRHPLKWRELDAVECDECCGKGFNTKDEQVGERKSDTQQFDVECVWCNGHGYIGPDAETRSELAKENS